MILICFLGKCRLVVILQDKSYVYDINSLAILDTIDTVLNIKGEIGSHYIRVLFNQKISFYEWPYYFILFFSFFLLRALCILPKFGWLFLGSSCQHLQRIRVVVQCHGPAFTLWGYGIKYFFHTFKKDHKLFMIFHSVLIPFWENFLNVKWELLCSYDWLCTSLLSHGSHGFVSSAYAKVSTLRNTQITIRKSVVIWRAIVLIGIYQRRLISMPSISYIRNGAYDTSLSI